ncbi:hypothetical protein [Polaribacter sp. L3A8]|uniref:hypothetical protein n=1 Tax=Polaribacter sp. L3A8 TaxID=2686361 RepID=UPI00131A642E|nr:hypothetical protein [Polaribacter sp. L3A8]
MKTTKTLLLIAIVLLSILLFRTCQNENICKHTELNKKEVIANFENSRHTIDITKVEELYGNYKNRFIPVIKDLQEIDTDTNEKFRENYLPTEYSLIPLQKLKDYLNFIEVLQQKNPEPIISGIAISFGAYDIDESHNFNSEAKTERKESILKDPLKSGDYRGRLTTFMTPTYYSEKNTGYDADNHIPFYIIPNDNSDMFKGEYKSLYCHLDSEFYCTEGDQKKEISKASFLPTFNAANAKITMQSVSSNELTDMPPKRVGE